jgi:hypothetical protein
MGFVFGDLGDDGIMEMAVPLDTCGSGAPFGYLVYRLGDSPRLVSYGMDIDRGLHLGRSHPHAVLRVESGGDAGTVGLLSF